MIVLDNSGKQIDPTTIDWQKARKGSFPYRIRQQPGAQNALGRVKFMFPNKYSVYLHDTPSKELFSRDGRTFSSGCIRIEKPRELAELLLENDSKWNPDKIEEAMFSEQEQSVVLKNKVGIYIYYLTAWGLINGEIHFREDIYSRDEELYKELQKAKY
jgi:murein L,D-transpeptidase YcbB/YkuD